MRLDPFGLSVLIVVFAANADPQLAGTARMGHQISAVLVGAAVMNVLAIVLTAVFILPANTRLGNGNASSVVTLTVSSD